MHPDISIIIPCFNAGIYLEEAVRSARSAGGDYSSEIILINDGSNDPVTLAALEELSKTNIVILHQENKGPAAARNAGIQKASASLVLFLDSDNRLRPGFISQAITMLSSNVAIDIIYGKPHFFGDVLGKRDFKTGPYDLQKLWIENYIDMCSVVRKHVFAEIGLLDEHPVMIGHEDWELWLRAGIAGKQFHFLDQEVFDYRLNPNGLHVNEAINRKYLDMVRYVYGKHYEYFQRMMFLNNTDRNRPVRTFFKYFYRKYLVKQN